MLLLFFRSGFHCFLLVLWRDRLPARGIRFRQAIQPDRNLLRIIIDKSITKNRLVIASVALCERKHKIERFFCRKIKKTRKNIIEKLRKIRKQLITPPIRLQIGSQRHQKLYLRLCFQSINMVEYNHQCQITCTLMSKQLKSFFH